MFEPRPRLVKFLISPAVSSSESLMSSSLLFWLGDGVLNVALLHSSRALHCHQVKSTHRSHSFIHSMQKTNLTAFHWFRTMVEPVSFVSCSKARTRRRVRLSLDSSCSICLSRSASA